MACENNCSYSRQMDQEYPRKCVKCGEPEQRQLALSMFVKKDMTADLEFYRNNILYYSITIENEKFRFPVPTSDSGDGVFSPKMKTVNLMRWIRKSIDNQEIYIEKIINK